MTNREDAKLNNILYALRKAGVRDPQDVLASLKDSGYAIQPDRSGDPVAEAKYAVEQAYSFYRTPILITQRASGAIYVKPFGG